MPREKRKAKRTEGRIRIMRYGDGRTGICGLGDMFSDANFSGLVCMVKVRWAWWNACICKANVFVFASRVIRESLGVGVTVGKTVAGYRCRLVHVVHIVNRCIRK